MSATASRTRVNPCASSALSAASSAANQGMEALVFTGGHSGNRFAGTPLGHLVVPVPANYLRGIDEQRRDLESEWPSYLAGEWRLTGWWYYYLYALAVKVPLGIWALVFWSVGLTLFRHRSSAAIVDELGLWLPAMAVLVLVSSQTGFNHHMRYVLPLFPFVVIATTKTAYYFRAGRWLASSLVASCFFWALCSSLLAYPHSVSYFNEAAGGPGNGNAHLLDSNIDWGQDLLFLRDWLQKHPEARPLGLAYMNTVDPRIVGLEFDLPPPGMASSLSSGEQAAHETAGPQPGYFAVSVNFIRGMAYQAPNGRGSWHSVSAQDYVYFRQFQPSAKAGYSIFIYRISLEEANEVRRNLGLPCLGPDTGVQPQGP